MACKYKYKDNWYSKEEAEKLIKQEISKDDILLELLKNYSFAIEVNTAIQREYEDQSYLEPWERNEIPKNITRNTQYYSNLTVAGGTNYTENEIATPLITPSIKGHAQFSTDNGIGWFRSDEQVEKGTYSSEMQIQEDEIMFSDSTTLHKGTPTKTRRILELQSDLFQRGRDKEDLISKHSGKSLEEFTSKMEKLNKQLDNKEIDLDEYKKFREIYENNYNLGERFKNLPDNQFLQLLNRDNNWVTFFIKSIIQDSAKKGYEKVLFPSGNTASKVEGHTTLEEFKKQKEDRIKELEKDLKFIKESKDENFTKRDKELAEERTNKELTQLKVELQRVETEGFGALKPIYNFYEIQVKNILKKNYNVKEITDEYGNTWNEVEITPKILNKILLQQKAVSKEKPIKELNNQLIQLLNKLGVTATSLKEYKDWYKSKYGTELEQNPVALADLTNKIIAINEDKESVTTLPEEVSHFVIAVIKQNNSELYSKLEELVVQDPSYESIFKQYINAYKGDVKLVKFEALGKILATSLVNEFKVSQGQNSGLIQALKRLFERFMNLFKKNKNLTEEINELAKQILNKETKLGEFELKSTLYQLDVDKYKESEELNNYKDKLEDLIKKRVQRLKIYENKSLKDYSALERQKVDRLLELYKADKVTLGIIEFINSVAKDAELSRKRLVKELKENGSPTVVAGILREIKDYTLPFKQTLSQLRTELRSNDKEELKEVISEISDVLSNLEDIENIYKESSVDVMSKALFAFKGNNDLTQEDLAKLLKEDVDISLSSRFLDSMAESGDNVLGILDRLTKERKEVARINSLYKIRELLALDKQLKDNGVKDTSFAFETYEGKKTGNLLSEYNQGAFEIEKRKFADELVKKIKEDFNIQLSKDSNEKDIQLSKNKAANKYYRTAWRNWMKNNTQANPNADKIIIAKKKYFNEKYGNEKFGESLRADLAFNDWFNSNTVTSAQSGTTYMTNELILPADKYKNAEFDKISGIKKKYLDKIWEIKQEQDKYLHSPSQYLAPQIRKDYLERVRDNGIKTVAKEAIQDLKSIREDDTNFGNITLTDIDNKPVNFIPTYFTNKLSNMDDLSEDLTATMASYIEMSENYKEMTKIVSLLELGEDIIGERKVIVGDSALNKMFEKLSLSGSKAYDRQKGGNSYERYKDWMQMVVYGKMKADENWGNLMGLNTVKAIDAFNKYTSISGLAFNVYSGLNNVVLGNALARQEAFSREFIGKGGLTFADKTYWKELPEFLNSVGNPYSDNKLKLVGELLDVFSDFKEKTKEINTDRGRATRLLSTDSLYMLNSVGEHQIQWRTALAVLDNIKLQNNGKSINAWEAIEIKDGKPVIKEGTTLNGKSFTIDDIIATGLRIKALNQKLHGIYNDVDRNALQRWSLGRMAMMFRKYIKPGINRRFDKKRYDYSLDSKVEGMYVTTFNFLNQIRKDLASYKLIYSQLDSYQKANLRRTALEAAYIGIAVILMGITEAGLDDDKDNWLLAQTAYQANRLYTDLTFYVFPTSAFTILKDPLAGVKTMELATKLLNPLSSFDINPLDDDPFVLRYKTGKHKGETHLYRNTLNLIPGLKNLEGLSSPQDKLKYFN